MEISKKGELQKLNKILHKKTSFFVLFVRTPFAIWLILLYFWANYCKNAGMEL